MSTPFKPDTWPEDADGFRPTLCSVCGTPVRYGSRHSQCAPGWKGGKARTKAAARPAQATAAMTQRAFEIADQAMFELLNSECIPQDDRRSVFGLVSESYTEVRSLAEASDAIREAVEWLEPRGFVKVSKDEAGEYIDVLRRPGDDN